MAIEILLETNWSYLPHVNLTPATEIEQMNLLLIFKNVM